MTGGGVDGHRHPVLVRWARPASSGGAPELAGRVLAPLGLALLSDPTEASVGMLAGSATPPSPGPFASALEELARSAGEAELLAARVEYTRLFHSPRGALCPPWECVALDPAPHLMGPRHEDVLRFYRRAGVEPQRSASESADHVGLELAFLSLLSERMSDGEDLSELFEEFWASHVATWMPGFASRLGEEARVPLFRTTGDLLLQAVTLTQAG